MPNDSFDLSSLESFDLNGLTKKGSAGLPAAPNGKPLIVPISELIEDPDQPRTEDNPGFSAESIAEMAESIKAQGIKQPIIVRSKNDAGKYQINDGARRYRGAKVAELAEVPIIIDDEFDRVAQLMVNLQREGNTPDEIAAAIAELEGKGMSRADIARGMGKNKGYVSEYAKFSGIAPIIRALYDNGECKDVKICNQLDDLFNEYPVAVLTFVSSNTAINRRTVAEFAKGVKEPAKPIPQEPAAPAAAGAVQSESNASTGGQQTGGEAAQAPNSDGKQESSAATGGEGNEGNDPHWPFKPVGGDAAKPPEASKQEQTHQDGAANPTEGKAAPSKAAPSKAARMPVIRGSVDNQIVRLVLDKKVTQEGHCWVEFEDAEKQEQVPCNNFTMVSIEH